MSAQPVCTAMKRDGSPCRAPAVDAAGTFCIWHDPATATERQEWRSRGGVGKSKTARAAKRIPEDMRGVADTILRAIGDVERGLITPAVASSIATLARAYSDIWQTGELVTRLEELENRAREQKGR